HLRVGEDGRQVWYIWHNDRRQRQRLRPAVTFVGRMIVTIGPLQVRIRSRYRVGHASAIAQDTVFQSTTPRVDFDTLVDWHEKYQLLKTAFSIDVLADSARHEVQFGHINRSTHDNTSWDRAQFDVCAHKWTDIAETEY